MQTFNYFMSLDMPVMELLGSSETGGPQTACLKVPFLSVFLTFENDLFFEQYFPRAPVCDKEASADLIPTLRRPSSIPTKSIYSYYIVYDGDVIRLTFESLQKYIFFIFHL